ncbi:arrestin domain-containing protein 3-like isoform X1 [Anguilla anguilla]|uniref:arrestin domain-containing protein 3-like isoform X1 n=2 Tax=Anguilla anguilla TaxID=7936 RepID=UPI0015A8FF42|nr:arrestin domain-containing protein 3-like isoform X1 [Anguilla anguilla]
MVHKMFEKPFKSFAIIYEDERKTFSSGEFIKGQIRLELCEGIKLCAIMLALKGEAKVSWFKGYGENKRTYSAREEYFNIKEVLLGEDNNGVGEGNIVLQEGMHEYPFRVQLPQGNFPSSCKGFHGSVVYCLEVQIHRPWRMPKFQSEFNFVSKVEVNHPQLLVPQSASSNKKLCCLCCASGPISIGVQLEKKSFAPGEMINITAEFENFSSRTLVPSAALAQTQTFYTCPKKSEKRENIYLALVEGKPLPPHSRDGWENQMLQIPADTPLTLSNCQIMELEYSLVVRVAIPWGVDLKAKVPLVIGSAPSCRPLA